MRIACWITKTTDTHSEYAMLVGFARELWLHERASFLRLCVHCLSCLSSAFKVAAARSWPLTFTGPCKFIILTASHVVRQTYTTVGQKISLHVVLIFWPFWLRTYRIQRWSGSLFPGTKPVLSATIFQIFPGFKYLWHYRTPTDTNSEYKVSSRDVTSDLVWTVTL